jgi:hypothetical protein
MKPSATYRLFKQAILERKQIICVYNGKHRELCPIVLGYKNGEEKCLTFQVGGESTSQLPPRGEWRCLELSKVRNARMRDGPWREGDQHGRPQACIDIVDLDVNIPATLRR